MNFLDRSLGSVLVSAFAATANAQTPSPVASPSIHIIYMGGDDCPPCVNWRRFELPKLKSLDAFKNVVFSYVPKRITEPVPTGFFVPSGAKPFMAKLEHASNGTVGSPHTAILLNGEVFDYRFGVYSAAEFEKRLLAMKSTDRYPFDRCLRLTKQRNCEAKGE